MVKVPDICLNKFFIMGLSASFMFSMFLYNVVVSDVQDVKGDFVSKADEIKKYVDENQGDIKELAKSTSRIEGKLDILLSKTP